MSAGCTKENEKLHRLALPMSERRVIIAQQKFLPTTPAFHFHCILHLALDTATANNSRYRGARVDQLYVLFSCEKIGTVMELLA
jgi:hypothetical protein